MNSPHTDTKSFVQAASCDISAQGIPGDGPDARVLVSVTQTHDT